MKKNSKPLTLLFIIFCFFTQANIAQVTGDFRTNSSASFTGNWNASTSWERYNGTSWDASGSGSNNPGQTPTSTSSVWIQTGALITLTQNESCKDLNICNSTTSSLSGSVPGRINIQAYTLNVNGKLSCYYGALSSVPGTPASNGFSYYPFTGSTGKVSIVGNTRNLTNLGAWGATITTTTNGFFPLEINLNSNQIVTLVPNIKCTALNVISGTFNIDTATVSIDVGTDGQGDITIFNGATISCSTSGSATNIFQKTSSKRCGTFTINSGGTFTVLGGTPKMDVNSVLLNGTVNYSKSSGTQNFLQKNKDSLSTDITSYTNIILSGSGTKTLSGNLTINGTLSLGNNTLNIAGNTLTLNGDFTTGTGVIKSNGSGSVYVGGSGTLTNNLVFDQTNLGTNNRIKHFTLNRGTSASTGSVTLGNSLEITGTLTLTNGTFYTGEKLTLASTSTETANITTIQSTADISGNVKTQRHIPSIERRYRFLSSSISNANLEDWKGEIFITGNNLPTAHQSTIIGNLNWGFDATSTNNPSVYYYDETVVGAANQGWTAVTNSTSSLTNIGLTVGKGYRVFVRGDRTNSNRLNGTETTQNAVTLDLNGTINKGNIAMPVSFTSSGTSANDGWCFLGNPYPCAFNWDAFYDAGTNFSHINPTVYIFDATSNTYKDYNASSNSGSLTNGIIPNGAGFFVQTNASSPTLTFTETYKTTSAYLNTFKTSSDEMMINFIADSINIDKFTLKYLTNATDNFDRYDILKLQNPTVNLFSYGADSVQLITSVRKFQSRSADTILLGVSSTFSGLHKFEFTNIQNFAINKKIYLVDNFTSTLTDVIKNTMYNFDINSNPNSYGINRFKLIITDSILMNTGINQTESKNNLQFTIFPNPATDRIFICTQNPLISQAEIKIIDMTGRIILQKNNMLFDKNLKLQLPVNEINEGVYFIQITTPQFATSTIKFVK